MIHDPHFWKGVLVGVVAVLAVVLAFLAWQLNGWTLIK